MSGVSRQRFGPVESCVDYQSYLYKIDPGLTAAQYAESRRLLMALGRADEERMGVVYVRGPWGFFVIPRHGYPTLRVSFYHDTPDTEIEDVLASICAAFEAPNTINNQGDSDE
jgi:hypothetical protein